MNQLTIITLVYLLAFSCCQGDLDCNVTLPRLLIGDKYYDPSSNITALILFDTKDDCKDVVNLIPGKDTTFNFTVGNSVK